MGRDVEATPEDVEIALLGILLQAEAHGLDVNEERVRAFCGHQAKVKATAEAMQRRSDGFFHPS